MLRPLIFNGKFYCGTLNGVHRVADRLIREVDGLLAAMPAKHRPEARLLLPARRGWTPELTAITLHDQAGGHTQRWEQGSLPGLAKDGVLINLCNLAPLRHRRQILLMHDAQFLFPDSSYPWRQRWGHRLLAPRMARRSAQVLTVSQYSRQILDLTGVSARDDTAVLYNGVDHILDVVPDDHALQRFGLRPQGYVLLFGSSKRYKNVELLFEAFRLPELAGLTLVVVGQGRPDHVAAGMVPPENAVFTGRITDETLRPLYENAICTALPSRTEGFGLPPLEGMLLGCPAVVAPAGAMPEVCRDAACYADVDTPRQWADAILRLQGDPAFRAAKIAAGRQRAAEFTWRSAGVSLLKHAMAIATRPAG